MAKHKQHAGAAPVIADAATPVVQLDTLRDQINDPAVEIEALRKLANQLLDENLAFTKAAAEKPKAGSRVKGKKALYHRAHAEAVELTVVEEHEDGTVDLAGADGKVAVRRCPVTNEAKSGHATVAGKSAKAKAAEEGDGFEDLGE